MAPFLERWLVFDELTLLKQCITTVVSSTKLDCRWFFFFFFDVDAILIQIIKHNDCVDVIKDFLAARLNYLLEHNVIVKNKYNIIASYSLNGNAQTYDLIEMLPSCK